MKAFLACRSFADPGGASADLAVTRNAALR
jgi:hypothetical protein